MATDDMKTWITEEEAASIMELPANFFRKLVLAGPLNGVVKYLSPQQDSYQYNKADLENYMFEDSFFAAI